jgi:DNA processing protein
MTPCVACLRRSRLIGFLAVRIADALADRRGASEILALSDEDLIAALAGDAAPAALSLVRRFDRRAALAELEAAGLHGVCRHDASYPRQLHDLGDPPALLHSTIAPDALADLCAGPSVAVVGTRRASAYGLEVARELGRGLAAAGVTVVSGLALGIDAAAHRGALDAAGPTVAVLGCGADRAYPRTNAALYERIRAEGAVIAELPPGQRPHRWTFPARNRIMAGLAQVTVVVEAAERSGSLITAAFAQDLGREVGAVPGRVTARMAAGANELLHAGAAPVRGAGDVLDMLFGAGNWQAGERSPAATRKAALDPGLERILRAVEAGDVVEEFARGAGLPAADVRAALGRLELLGLVRRDGLGAYERVAGR